MKITILDAYSVNPGDLSWQPVEALGEVTIWEHTSRAEIIPHIGDAEIVLTNKVPLDADTLMALPGIRYIGILATGYNIVDTGKAAELGITVCNIPSYSTTSVAQMVFALLLAITNSVELYTNEIKEGKWCRAADFCYWNKPIMELAGKQMGIIGFGNIGHETTSIARALGMRVMVSSSKSHNELPEGIQKGSVEEVFATSDVISLHCPLTDKNAKFVNATLLSVMKPTAILINTARGGLIDEEALSHALNSGKIAAAGLDVLSTEPPLPDNPMLSAKNCVITPHLGWATVEARTRLIDIAAANIEAWQQGQPVNIVS